MIYRLRSGEDARFELEDGAITLHSRGGSKKQMRATNTEYGKALREILGRLHSASIAITDAYVDSARVQQLSIPERRIIDPANIPTSVPNLFAEMSRRMQRVGQSATARSGNSTKRIRIEVSGDTSKARLIAALDAVPDGA